LEKDSLEKKDLSHANPVNEETITKVVVVVEENSRKEKEVKADTVKEAVDTVKEVVDTVKEVAKAEEKEAVDTVKEVVVEVVQMKIALMVQKVLKELKVDSRKVVAVETMKAVVETMKVEKVEEKVEEKVVHTVVVVKVEREKEVVNTVVVVRVILVPSVTAPTFTNNPSNLPKTILTFLLLILVSREKHQPTPISVVTVVIITPDAKEPIFSLKILLAQSSPSFEFMTVSLVLEDLLMKIRNKVLVRVTGVVSPPKVISLKILLNQLNLLRSKPSLLNLLKVLPLINMKVLLQKLLRKKLLKMKLSKLP